MEEKRSVRQVLEPGGIVRHDIFGSREVVGRVAVAVLTLVQTGVVAEVGAGAVGGDGPFCHAGDSRGVVGRVRDGHVGGVMVVGYDGDLSQ